MYHVALDLSDDPAKQRGGIITSDERSIKIGPGASLIRVHRAQFCLRASDARPRPGDGGPSALELSLKVSRVNPGQELPAFHYGVEIRVELLDLSGDLAANLDRHDRLHDSGRVHDRSYGSRVGWGREVFNSGRASASQPQTDGCGHHRSS